MFLIFTLVPWKGPACEDPSSLSQLCHRGGSFALSEGQSFVSKQGAPRGFERGSPEGTFHPRAGTLDGAPRSRIGLASWSLCCLTVYQVFIPEVSVCCGGLPREAKDLHGSLKKGHRLKAIGGFSEGGS